MGGGGGEEFFFFVLGAGPPPHKFSNGPSLAIINKLLLYKI